ncbi:MAG TPA: hypothetical protein VGX68_23755 [Thermoanaerobaculia bacterium]|jgi:hypothetical protein|nr:hypothetical protein [Thermoanaerobaculia bacterium]
MTEEQKRKAIHEFFDAPQPLRDVRAIVIGACFAVVGLLMLVNQSVSVGLLLLAAGGLWAVCLPLGTKGKAGEQINEVQYFSLLRFSPAKARFDARPSLSQMVNWLKEDLQGVEQKSLDCLGLVETTRQPITVFGPLYRDGIEGIDSSLILRRRVEDGYFYSTYHMSVFQFTESFLGAFQANYSMIKNVTTGEETDEFFYRDVVAVKTKTEASSYVLKSGEKLEHSKMFSLSVSSGDKIAVVINDPKIQSTKAVETLGDEAVNNIRAMLRQFKVVSQVAV